jgi:hypothetical protein
MGRPVSLSFWRIPRVGAGGEMLSLATQTDGAFAELLRWSFERVVGAALLQWSRAAHQSMLTRPDQVTQALLEC